MTVETIPKKKKTQSDKPDLQKPWQVILFNDDIHSFNAVIIQVQKATGCSTVDATRVTVEAHFNGKAVAFQGEFVRCQRVTGILREIQLIVEIQG